MAVCESQLESGLARLKREGSDDASQERPLPAGLPLTVDYRSPVSHFVPPAVELYAARQKQDAVSSAESTETSTPVKRKRGRPRVDKTSPEYLANLAARKQAREMEALERKAMREHKRRSTGAIAKAKPTAKQTQGKANFGAKTLANKVPQTRTKIVPKGKVGARKIPQKTGKVVPARKMVAKKIVMRRNPKFAKVKRKDSGASSSTGDGTPRVKRKYTKRTPSGKKTDGSATTERVKGKRGRPRKDQMNKQTPKIRVRSNLMPVNNEPISLDSDDENELGSPGADSLSLDENLRALRHIHEKYANIDKDDLYEAHLLAANFKKPPQDGARIDDDVLSVRSSDGSVKDLDTRVEKLEDSSNSDSDSSSSGSGSSSSGSSSSSSGSSDSSDSSDSDNEQTNNHDDNNIVSPPSPWAPPPADSDSDPERSTTAPPAPTSHDELSESDNESPDKSFQCHICHKWYSTRVTLKIHRRSHQNRGGGGQSRARTRGSHRYTCDICGIHTTRREKLYAHKLEAHRGAMTFRCSVCERCFEHDDELAAHLDTHTDDDRNGRCTECNTSYTNYAQLTAHRAAAHGGVAGSAANGPHACAHCGKRFTHVHSLTRHLHNHAKQLYRCVVCKASFARADQLAQHLNSHLANYKRLKP